MKDRILIVGAGPAGLGCAWALHKTGHQNFQVFERNPYPGGLGASFRDEKGFRWDIGAHLHFRRQPEYVGLLDAALGDGWVARPTASRIWTHGRFIPHPFQLHVRHLPSPVKERCLAGLQEAKDRNGDAPVPANFEQWMRTVYGSAITDEFLAPYCRKAWSYNLADMSAGWALKRFPPGDTDRCIAGESEPRPAPPYPLTGGNGAVWVWLADRLRSRIVYSKAVSGLDTRTRSVSFSDGTAERYDALVSTMPLDELIARSDLSEFHGQAKSLRYTSVVAIGLGLRGPVPPVFHDVGWIFSAEPEVPFYRVTVHSNLSPHNVPAGADHWSLLMETAHKPGNVPPAEPLIRASLAALSRWGISVRDEDLADTWVYEVDHAYPVPSLGREEAVDPILRALRDRGVYSCGRFGAWRYESANQDDCFVEGIANASSLI